MTKGKPWPAEDEQRLRQWFSSGTTNFSALVFAFEGRYTKEAIRQKLISFGLLKEQQQVQKNACCCSSKPLELPEELPSVEEALKMLAAALYALDEPGMDKSEVLRLRGIIAGAKVYEELFANYVNYRELEEQLLELRQKYEELKRSVLKKTPNNAPS